MHGQASDVDCSPRCGRHREREENRQTVDVGPSTVYLGRRRSSITRRFLLGRRRSVTSNDPPDARARTIARREGVNDTEELSGVRIRKVNEMEEGGNIEKSKDERLRDVTYQLSQLRFLRGFSTSLLEAIAPSFEERTFGPGEYIFREGDRQQWLAVLRSGRASVQIRTACESSSPERGRAGTAIAELHPSAVFGDLQLLGIRDARISSVVVHKDCSCVVSSLASKVLWAAVDDHSADKEYFLNEGVLWRSFLSSHLASKCHPEVAYQLRLKSTLRVLAPGQELVFGGSATESPLADTAAIVETGGRSTARTGDEPEALVAGAIVNYAALLGTESAQVVMSSEGMCHVALLKRHTFWETIANLAKERQAFTDLAIERSNFSSSLVKFDLEANPFLSFLQGPSAFRQTLQTSLRRRICPPGTLLLQGDSESDALVMFQLGTAEVLVGRHSVRRVHAGEYSGELSFLRRLPRAQTRLRALSLCVVQELRYVDVAASIQRFKVVSAQYQQLTNLSPCFNRNLPLPKQVEILRQVTLFSELSEEFLSQLIDCLEDRLYLPRQEIMAKGKTANRMCLIQHGEAVRTREDGVMIPVQAGETIGDIEILCDTAQDCEVVTAHTPCCVQELHRAMIIELLQAHPHEQKHFQKMARASLASRCMDQLDTLNIVTLPFFEGCGTRFVNLLELHFEREIRFRGEVIVEQGAEGDEMYIMDRGNADVVVSGTKVGTLKAGQCFGEMAVLGVAKTRMATIIACELCHVRVLSQTRLEDALGEFPEERTRFETLASARIRISLQDRFGGRIKQTSAFFHTKSGGDFAERIQNIMEDRLFMGGQVIMTEGESGDWMMILHKGTATVSVGGRIVAQLTGGDTAGEHGVLGLWPIRTATIKAVDVCCAQILFKATLQPILDDFPEEYKYLRSKAAQRHEMRAPMKSIESFRIFRGASQAFIDSFEHEAQRFIFFSGDVMIAEGEVGSSVMFIRDGRAQVEVGMAVVREVCSGDVVGDLGAMGIVERRTATVRCKDICDVYVVAGKALLYSLAGFPEMRERWRSIAAGRLRGDIERATQETLALSSPLLKQCSVRFVQRISRHFRDNLFMPGEVVCAESESGDALFFVLDGELDCIIAGTKVKEIGKGSVIGEIAVLGMSGVRTATIQARTVCLVYGLQRSTFMKYACEFPRDMLQFQALGVKRLEASPITCDSNLLRQHIIFRRRDAEFLAQLDTHTRRKFYLAKQEIIHEHAECHEMYAIAQGHVVVEQGGRRIRELECGVCFGEKFGLGLMSRQALTVRAGCLSELHVLHRSDLDGLLKEFPKEREDLMAIVAKQLREELAEVNNFDVLAEVPLLRREGQRFIEQLDALVTVQLAREGEPVLSKDDEKLVAILQGSVALQVGGAPVRTLCEGDNYGAASVLGLCEANNITARAVGTCLYLSLSRGALSRILMVHGRKLGTAVDTLKQRLMRMPDVRQRAVAQSALVRHLELDRQQIDDLLELCEEMVHVGGEPVLLPVHQPQVLLFVLAGEVVLGNRQEGQPLEQATSLGNLYLETPLDVEGQLVTAKHLCKTLMLHQTALTAFIERQSPEEAVHLRERLATQPREQRGTTERDSGLHVAVERVMQRCVHAAKQAISARALTGGMNEETHDELASVETDSPSPAHSLSRRPQSASNGQIGIGADSTSAGQNIGKGQASIVALGKEAIERAATSPKKNNKKLKQVMEPSQDALKRQCRLLVCEMMRLTEVARQAADIASKDTVRFRAEAARLRAQLNEVSEARAPSADVDNGSEPAGQNEAAESEALRRWNVASEKRIMRLSRRLKEVRAEQENLLARLRSTS